MLQQRPDQARGNCTHGVFLFHLNRLKDAAAELHQTIALDATYANTLCNLGFALHPLEKDGEAEDAYRRALKADPNYKPARTGLAANVASRCPRSTSRGSADISPNGLKRARCMPPACRSS